MTLADSRREYRGRPLDEADAHPDPFAQLARWLSEIADLEPDPTAMVLATSTREGRPSLRTVLLKDVDAAGLVFYTNYDSQKAHEIAQTGFASLLFFWPTMHRQVRIAGRVEQVSAADSDAYFLTRPLESRWSVYASHQSEVVPNRDALDAGFAAARAQYGADVPRPEWWGGYRVLPDEFEFWQGRPNRLHDRLRYTRDASGAWPRVRLAP